MPKPWNAWSLPLISRWPPDSLVRPQTRRFQPYWCSCLMHELPATLRGLQHAVASRRISPQEALSLQRQRFKDRDARFHSVMHMLPDHEQVRQVQGGVLEGIGLAHKDIFNTAGRKPGAGNDAGCISPGLSPAPAVSRLEKAGAATLATLSMAEYACVPRATTRPLSAASTRSTRRLPWGAHPAAALWLLLPP